MKKNAIKKNAIYQELYKKDLKPMGLGDILIASGLVSLAFGTILTIKNRMGGKNKVISMDHQLGSSYTVPLITGDTNSASISTEPEQGGSILESEGTLEILGL